MNGPCRFWLFFSVLALVAHSQEDAEPEDAEPEEGIGEPEEGDIGSEQEPMTSEQMRSMHSKIDGNKDGKISMPEIIAYSDAMRKTIAKKDTHTAMNDMDLDKDGKLSLAELMKDMEQYEEDKEDKAEAAKQKELETAKFHAADGNKDGFLDSEELPALFYPETHEAILEMTAAADLKPMDTNSDGQLTLKEFFQVGSVDGEDPTISDKEQADFAKLDVDGSGTLNVQELMAWESGRFQTEEAMRNLFEVADQDKDGHITADEIDTARELIAASEAHDHLMEWHEHAEL